MIQRETDRVFVFIDDEVSISTFREEPRYKAIEQGRRLEEKCGLRCVPITSRKADGTPITDVSILSKLVADAIERHPTVALVVDVIQHKYQRRGIEILEFLRRSAPKTLEALRAIILWSKDSAVRDESDKLAEMFPNQTTAVLDRITQFDELVSILSKL